MSIIGFIGTGKMGGALAAAAAKCKENEVLLANRHKEKAEKLCNEIGGSVVDNLKAANCADFLFIGVKPQMMETPLNEIKSTLAQRSTPFVIVSMMAGVSMSTITEILGKEYPIIRIMPNIPVCVGEGMIMYANNSLVTDDQIDTFLNAMRHGGRFAKVSEKMIDAGSGVSGCGPAFVAMFIEALADGGVACGLTRKDALEFAEQTLLGSAKYLLETGLHPGELKDAVCSPGGTTIQGVRTLEENGFRGAVMDAVITASTYTIKK